MKPSENCIELVKKWEGCHKRRADGLIEAYLCPAGVPTIGWGSIELDGRPVKLGDVINQAKADGLLAREIEEKADGVLRALGGYACTQNQFDAFVSFAYNLGVGAFAGSTLLRKFKEGDVVAASHEFLRWVNADGEVLEGLVNRRKEERALFLKDAAPSPEVSADDSITWLEFFRIEENGCVITGVAAYAGAECRITWSGSDMAAFRQFVARFKNAAYAPLVAPTTKPWPTVAKPVEPEKPKEVVCRLTRIGGKDSIGCEKLMLKFEGTDDYLIMRSGVPSKQNFRKANDPQCVPGSLEPIPQPPTAADYYYIHDIDFAGSRDDYNTVFSTALGPVKVWLENKFPMRRSEFLFHVDGGAPGSAGCVCTSTIAELKKLVALLRKHNPRKLYVDWGL